MLVKSDIEGLQLLRRGKVRDVYELGDRLLIVSTDRLSAFDHVLPNPIPEKGKILTEISAWWFERTKNIVPNHMISTDFKEIQGEMPRSVRLDRGNLDGRIMLVWKADRVDVECVARGYLAGSGFKEYAATGTVAAIALPKGLLLASKLPEPIFTPATKADAGHDENITFARLTEQAGAATAKALKELTLKLYVAAAGRLEARGVLLCDTKFEFGWKDGKLILIDELLTPDSSRLWPAASWKPGRSPESFDKQFVRDYLERLRWNKQPPVPSLPPEVVAGTARRYQEFLRIVTS